MGWIHVARRVWLALTVVTLALAGAVVLLAASSSQASGAIRPAQRPLLDTALRPRAKHRSRSATSTGLKAQRITFTSAPPAGAMVGGPTYTVTATASSGLPVAFTIPSGSASVCSISGATVSFTGVGRCTIDASQPGNATYAPAPTVVQSVWVGRLYWFQNGSGKIEWANLNPPGGNQDLLPGACIASVAVNSQFIYWTDFCTNGGIGRAKLDGSDPNPNFIPAAKTQSPRGLAINGNSIYWTNFTGSSIGRANLDGANATENYISTGTDPAALTIDGRYLYWANSSQSTIGRAQLNGSGVNQSFVPNVNPSALAVDAHYLYWTDNGSVGRANLDGTGANQQYITVPGDYLSGLAVDGAHIYWTDSTASVISRANLDGSHVDPTFLTIGSDSVSLAESGPASQPTPKFTSTAPANALVGDTYTVSATGSGGSKNPVRITVDPSASGVCSILNATVKFIGAGNCTLDANQAGNTNYFAAPQGAQTIPVHRRAQTITFTSTPPASAGVGAHYTVTAKSSSGLTVALTIDKASTKVCSISGATVSFNAFGTCTIDANQPGNSEYLPAVQAQQSIKVGAGAQKITFTSTPPSGATVGQTYTVAASASSGLPVTLSIDPGSSTECSIARSTVTFKALGTCMIDANQGGNSSYQAAPQAQQKISVTHRGTQTIVFRSAAPAGAIVGQTYTVSASGGGSGNPVTLTIDPATSAVCSISGTKVTFSAVGTCTVDANQAGNANYLGASQAQQTFTVGHLWFGFSNSSGNGTVARSDLDGGSLDGSFLTGTGGSPGGVAVNGPYVYWTNYSSMTNSGSIGRANLNGSDANPNFITGLGEPEGVTVDGSYIYWTDQAANTIGRADLTGGNVTTSFITGASAPQGVAARGSYIYWANSSTNTIGRASVNNAGSANESFITGLNQPYESLDAVTLDPTHIYWTSGGYIGRANLDGSGANSDYIYNGSANGIAVSGDHIYVSDNSSQSIDRRNLDGSGFTQIVTGLSYPVGLALSGPTTQAAPTFTSTAPTNATVGGSAYTVSATSQSGGPVTFSIDSASSSVCAISGSSVTFNHAGTCTIDANQPGTDSYYASPQATQTFSVGAASQTITFTSTAPSNATVGGAPYTASATSSSGLPVTLTIDSSSSSVCSVSGTTVSVDHAGTCTIDANQPGDADYSAAPQVQQSFSVAPGSQAVTFTSTQPSDPAVADTYTVSATGGPSGNPVVITVDASSSSVCSISGSTVHFNTAGTCMIDANQAGNADYNAAPQVQQSITVNSALYWGITVENQNSTTTAGIGHAANDGGDLNGNFITGPTPSRAYSVVVAGDYVYWSDSVNHSIARANLDGTNVQENFIPNVNGPGAIAVDSSYVYWGWSPGDGTSAIGRANLDGSSPNENFITGLSNPDFVNSNMQDPTEVISLTSDGSHLYWTELDPLHYGGSIGRAGVDGSNVTNNFIPSLDYPEGLAVNSNHVYWTDYDHFTIGRANLDGTNPNDNFITGLYYPLALTVDGSSLYWSSGNDSVSPAVFSIGRANLDGSSVNQSLITKLPGPIYGLGVSSGPSASSADRRNR